MTGITLVLAAAVLAVLAVAVALVLGWANRAFAVFVDPLVEKLQAELPGSNCGGCGFVGCGEYAAALASGSARPTLCGPGGASCAERLGTILGVAIEKSLPYRAVVHCSATWEDRLQRHEYRGESTCAGANLVAGYQGCTYGCLGLGDCVRACDYDAIHVVDGLARVDYEKCTGCQACAKVCPRNIISMAPFRRERMLVVACSNKDFGIEVKNVCRTGCIGCKACAKANPALITMHDNVPVIDYEQYAQNEPSLQGVLDACKMESLMFVGKPTPRDVAAVAGEPDAERIEADFKTTVDDTEWWG